MLKTKANWKGSLSEYLKIGDLVDSDMFEYFISVLPPATMNNNCVQIGEPYDHIKNTSGKFKAIYATLKNTSEGWVYVGKCFKCEIYEPPNEVIKDV